MSYNLFSRDARKKDVGWSGTAPLNSGVVTAPAGINGEPSGTVGAVSPNSAKGALKSQTNMTNQPAADAIQNVNQPYQPTKGEVIGNPYLTALEKQKAATAEAQRTQYVPDKVNPGKGVANWIGRVFSPSSGKPMNTEASRASRQKLAAVTQMLRYAGQLAYMPKGATPQAVNDQVAQNEAKWQAEDAAAAKTAKDYRDYLLKLQQQEATERYRQGQLALGADRNEISRGNLGIAQGRYAMELEEHPYKLADRAAGIESKVAQTERTRVETDLAPQRFAETKRHNAVQEGLGRQRVALGWANHKLSQERLNYVKQNGGGYSMGGTTKKGEQLVVTPSGSRYAVSKNFMSAVPQIYQRLVDKGVMKPATGNKSIEINGTKIDLGEGKPTKAAMLDAIMEAADTRDGHDDFVWWAKRYGYRYIDGMTDAKKKEIFEGAGLRGATV